jgi:long-chain acyl-CoA synthetase
LIDVPELYSTKDQPFPRGEICVRGYNLFSGYLEFGESESSDDEGFERLIPSRDEEGWFRTGDCGEIDPEGRLRIIDR